MPELPEVETVKRSLEPHVVGEKIASVDIYYGGIIKEPDPAAFRAGLLEKEIISLGRRGKYLLFHLSSDLTLIIHLRMTGQLAITEPTAPVNKHTHFIIRFASGKELRFTDIRKFGLIYLIPEGQWHRIGGLASLGPEPLSDDFTLAIFQEKIKGKRVKLKAFLLDQRQVAGIGNIYADEILFASGLHPERLVNSLKPSEIEVLFLAIREALQKGVEHRGTSFRDYVDGEGAKGNFQNQLKAYGRGGEPCYKCDHILEKKNLGGRGTVICPHCQVFTS